MKDDTGSLNERWSWQIIDLLISCGVDYFCIAPGSRSSSLSLAAEYHPKAKTFVHFDERGLAFHALGYSKATKKPSVVIVTSGTAVGNLMPAIMEAHGSKTPLIILTADRPPELIDCGANQTTHQSKIFTDFVKWQQEIPCADNSLIENYLRSVMSYSVFSALATPMGPVHLNCMFREPLVTAKSTFCSHTPTLKTKYHIPKAVYDDQVFDKLADDLSSYKSGIIFIGSLEKSEDLKIISALQKHLSWPMIADITSCRSNDLDTQNLISHADLIFHAVEDLQADCILQFGGMIISKTISSWIKKQDARHILVADHFERVDPYETVNERYCCNISSFCSSIYKKLTYSTSSLLYPLKNASYEVKQIVKNIFSSQEKIQEPFLFYLLSKILKSHFHLFIANSMPIRDADSFFFPSEYKGQIIFNRGVSGIDGNIATAAGACRALNEPVIAIVGDLTFLHDMNSLSQIKSLNCPLILVVINNNGGGIFSFLQAKCKEEQYEKIMAHPHGIEVEGIAQAFGLQYHLPTTPNELVLLINEIQNRPRSCVIELKTQRDDNYNFHKHIQQQTISRLCSQQQALVT